MQLRLLPQARVVSAVLRKWRKRQRSILPLHFRIGGGSEEVW
jgi:hypothetical protein